MPGTLARFGFARHTCKQQTQFSRRTSRQVNSSLWTRGENGVQIKTTADASGNAKSVKLNEFSYLDTDHVCIHQKSALLLAFLLRQVISNCVGTGPKLPVALTSALEQPERLRLRILGCGLGNNLHLNNLQQMFEGETAQGMATPKLWVNIWWSVAIF